MADSAGSLAALFLSTSWKTNSYGPATWQLISDFCENTLKKKPYELLAIYCTVLDVEVSDEQKKDARRHGVRLIPATRSKWLDPDKHPLGVNWLIHHITYYPELDKLKNVGTVVGLSAKTKNAAFIIHRNIFPSAKLHHVSPKPAALFISNAWSDDELGLTGFNRNLVKDFCERKAKAGEDLKAYCTILDVKISDDQKTDAESCGVTLIPAQRKIQVGPKDDPQKLEWLLYHEIYYPDLKDLEDVRYIVGYAPKTGHAASYIRAKLFPKAKLVLINHACPESSCLEAEEYGLSDFEEKMLQMASAADLLFSIGPVIYEYFQNAYRAEFHGKDLSEIPHEEILPIPLACFKGKDPVLRETTTHGILTCGQVDTQKAIEKCETMAVSIGTAAKHLSESQSNINPPLWKIQGVSQQADHTLVKFLSDKMQCGHIQPTLHPGHSAKTLHRTLQQSHLCLPVPWYMDYSFYGFEAIVSGLPTAAYKHSHLARFIEKYLGEHADQVVVEVIGTNLSEKVLKHLQNIPLAFKKAKTLKTDMASNEVILKRYAKFASLLTLQQQIGASIDESGVRRPEKDSVAVHLGFDDTEYHRCLKELERQVQALPPQLKKEKEEMMNNLKAAWRDSKQALKRRVEDVLADKNCSMEIKKVCKQKMDDENPSSLTAKSLAILPRFLNLYNLYRLKQTCRYGSLARAFEPLLITNEMREIADKVGITLQLKATYDQEQFREVELFFIKRDGGGIQPMTIYDDVSVEDRVEEMQRSFQVEESCHVEGTDFSPENLTQKHDDQPTQHDTQTSVTTAVTETVSTLPLQTSEQQQLMDSDIKYLTSAQSTVQSLQSQLNIEKSKLQAAFTEKTILETQLAEALNEKSQLEKQCQECKQQYQVTQNKITTQLNEIHFIKERSEELDAELGKKDKLINELWTNLEQVSDAQTNIELLQKVTESLQLSEKFVTPEMQQKELSEMVSDNMDTKSKITSFEKEKTPSQKSCKKGNETETASPTQPEMTVRERSEMKTAIQTQPEMTCRDVSETETATPTQPNMTGSDRSAMKTAQVALETKHKKEKKDSGGIFSKIFQRFSGSKPKPGGTSLTPVSTEKQSSSVTAGIEELPSGSVFSEDISSGKKTTRSQRASGTWSRKTLKRQKVQMFNDPTGMAFHNDKLLVCDRLNSVVQILNQDYTCEKKLGSFSSRFAKPFRPVSIAVSQNNLYFILDDSNLQIVVCDQNNKISEIITLPGDSDPFCIALVQSFVIVTDLNGHRVLKYNQDRHYSVQLGDHQDDSHSLSNHPTGMFVAVNSRDLIMVSDWDNHCIQCFDTDFNYKYKYGKKGHSDGQLSLPSSIAIDGADNVYVCDQLNARVSMWSGDGTWRHHLFHREVREPCFIAVTADGDRIAVRGLSSNEIVVFSK